LEIVAMLKKILIVLVVLIVAFVVVVAMQPAEFHVARTATMSAPPSEIFEQVNDFHKWEAWSPWAKVDPDAKNTISEPASGKGATFKWSGNSEICEGSMTIVESRPHEHIQIQLDFVKPMAGTSNVEFHLKPEGDKTVVTWSMSGRNNFIGRAMCLFMNMDKMIGDKYEEGLASLKSIVEARPKEAAKG
jgi:hypothetical protein